MKFVKYYWKAYNYDMNYPLTVFCLGHPKMSDFCRFLLYICWPSEIFSKVFPLFVWFYMSPWPKVLFSIQFVTFGSSPHICLSTSFTVVMFGFLVPLHPIEVLVFLLQIVIAGTSRPLGFGAIVDDETKTFCFSNLSTEARPKMIQKSTTRLTCNSAFITGKNETCIFCLLQKFSRF